MENEPEKVATKPTAMEVYKESRRKLVHEAGEPKRAAVAKLLADLKARVDAHAGDGITGDMRFEIESETPPVLVITAPKHIPIRVKFDGGKMTFIVHRRRTHSEFDNLADALIHGEPLSFPTADAAPITFNTQRAKTALGVDTAVPATLPTPHKV